MPAAPKTDTAQEWKWKVESAATTLMEAEKIRTDAKLFSAAKAELRRRQGAIVKAMRGFVRRRGGD